MNNTQQATVRWFEAAYHFKALTYRMLGECVEARVQHKHRGIGLLLVMPDGHFELKGCRE